jgi:hypothetical protein
MLISAFYGLNRLVIETLEPLPKDRKCFRMINGVLVERTVKDVIPSLKTNADGLKKVLDELLKQYKGKQDEMDSWKVRHISRNPSISANMKVIETNSSGWKQKKNNVQVVQQ